MGNVIRRMLRLAPVTTVCIFACSVLLAWVYFLSISEKITFDAAQGRLGSVRLYSFSPSTHFGPFRLWEGQWWRVIACAFHHGGVSFWGGLVHLGLNCLAFWFLGSLLEPRIGRVRMALLVAAAIPFSMLPEFLVGHQVIGISGVVCALFGYLIVYRRYDRDIGEIFTDGLVVQGLGWIVLCVPLTYFEILPVANLAHFSGLGYGYLSAVVAHNQFRYTRLVRGGFLLAHLLLPVGFYFVQNPVWNGLYHWHYAVEHSEDKALQIRHLRRAVAIDPQLQTPWIALADDFRARGNFPAAWATILTGIYHNPSARRVSNAAQQMGRKIPQGPARELAKKILRDVFDDDANVWEEQLLAQAQTNAPVNRIQKDPKIRLRLKTKFQIQLPDDLDPTMPKLPKPLPPPDPDVEDSAAVGAAT